MCVQSRTTNQTMKLKPQTFKNFIIEGSHRNRYSDVVHPTKLNEYGSNELLFVIEREQDEFMGRKAGVSYFVKSKSPKRDSFFAESWSEVIVKLNETLK